MKNSGRWALQINGKRVILDAIVETAGSSVTPGPHYLSAILGGRFIVRSEPVPAGGLSWPIVVENRPLRIIVAKAKGHLLSLQID